MATQILPSAPTFSKCRLYRVLGLGTFSICSFIYEFASLHRERLSISLPRVLAEEAVEEAPSLSSTPTSAPSTSAPTSSPSSPAAPNLSPSPVSGASIQTDELLLKKKKSRLIDLVDAHNSRDDHVAAKRLLTEFRADESDDPRLLWRFSRTLYELSTVTSLTYDTASFSDSEGSQGSLPFSWSSLYRGMLYRLSIIPSTATSTTSKEALQEALRCAERAVAASKDGPVAAEAHLWYAIVLEALGRWKPLRERIADNFVIKHHYLKSLQFKPQSAVVLHCLGSWCYTVASINWRERKLAQLIAQDPPSSTYEEALGYFRAAEEVSPNFYSLNLLFIAKCYLKLKNEAKANEYLERVQNFAPIRSPEDEDAVKEAQRLLLMED